MISKLKGLIEEIGDTYVEVDVHGVCYRLACSAKTLSSLPALGEAVCLYTQMLVREDDISLLGFASSQERQFFQLLTSVQGVGTRVGLALLAIGAPQEISRAIAQQDKAFIARADGVGPKLAARLVNELKDKIGSTISAQPPSLSSKKQPQTQQAQPPCSDNQDAIAALVALGYKPIEAVNAVDFVLQSDEKHATVQDIIRFSLAKLARA